PMGANFTTAQKNAKLAEAITEMEKQNPLCKGKLGLVSAQQIYDDLNALTFGQTGTGLNGCSTNYKDYGFDQIGKTLLKGYSQIELEDCTKNFCSGDMLKAFLTTKFGKIKAQLITLTTPVKSLEMITVKDSSTTLGTTGTSTTIAKLDPVVDNSLTKLYRQALGPAIKLCTGDAKYAWFFKKENGTLLASDYIVPSDYYSENKTILAKPESTNGLAEMLKVTGKIRTAQKEKILIEFPSSTSGSFASKLGMTKLNDKYYMTLARYEGIITSIKSVGACDEKGKDCVITPCGEAVSITISVNEAQALASANGAKFVSGLYEKVDSTGKIIPGSDLNDEEKEKVYAAWPDSLDKIHQLAKYNTKLVDSGLNSGLAGDMKTTMIKDTTIALKQDLLTKLPDAIKSLKIEFKDKSKNEMKTLQIGRYPMEIDFDYSNKDATTATIIVSDLNTVDNAPRAAQNAMLMSGFEPTPTPKETILENSIQGTILGTKVSGNEMLFYKRVPMKLTVELRGGETGFSYRPTDPNFTMPTNLINWHEFGGIVKGLDAFLTSGFFGIKLSPQASAQDIKGIYYYPENGTLMIQPGNTGGSVIAKIMTYKPMTLNAVIPKKNESYSTIQATDIKLIDMTLDNVLKEVIDPNGFACPADGAINWNETKLLSAN
ncbi:MAG: hypothetical protein NTY48_01090, partial [Candidatus Diapherotrites archaeon]|nr:hypothetical protein [Candidatus Diapherotrites archaeon]